MILYKRLHIIMLTVLIIAGTALFSIYVEIDNIGEFALGNTVQQEASKQTIQIQEKQTQLPLTVQEKKLSSKTYYYGASLAATKQSNAVTYYHQDYLSSVRTQSDTTKKKVSSSRTAPFGADVYESSTQLGYSNNYKFTGQESDETLYYYGARYYSPQSGRFTQLDPVIDSASPYRYVSNNPLKFVDPTGMQSAFHDYVVSDDFIGPIQQNQMYESEFRQFWGTAFDIFGGYDVPSSQLVVNPYTGELIQGIGENDMDPGLLDPVDTVADVITGFMTGGAAPVTIHALAAFGGKKTFKEILKELSQKGAEKAAREGLEDVAEKTAKRELTDAERQALIELKKCTSLKDIIDFSERYGISKKGTGHITIVIDKTGAVVDVLNPHTRTGRTRILENKRANVKRAIEQGRVIIQD